MSDILTIYVALYSIFSDVTLKYCLRKHTSSYRYALLFVLNISACTIKVYTVKPLYSDH